MNPMANPLPILLTIICTTLFLTGGAPQPQHAHGGGTGCVPTERAALLSFKEQITTDPHGLLSSWHGRECCQWSGITCSNRTGQVLKLELRNPNPVQWFGSDAYDDDSALRGEISPSLLSLEKPEHIDFSMNCFLGANHHLPMFLGSMKNMRYMNLFGIPFTGELPPQLGNLSKLQYLDLGNPPLRRFSYALYSTDITWLTYLLSLQYLHMSQINLSRIADWPQKLNMIPALTVMYLTSCALESANQSLQYLNLTKLKKLDLTGNNFNHTIASCWFLRATSLQHLILQVNRFVGPLPDALGNLTSLEVLDLSVNYNHDLTITRNFKNICRLEILDLTSNGINTDITGSMENLPQCTGEELHELRLGYNNFTGTLPRWISHFKSLTILDLNSNNLSGSVPTEIGALSKLTSLDLGNNKFSGVIREEHFVGLISLQHLDLSLNNLNIVVEADWFPLFRLESAFFASCHMGPLFPAWLNGQIGIRKLVISNTTILGNIPDWFWPTFSKAIYLDISHNQLTGTLPAHFDGMAFQLTGSIPPLPRNITLLDISNNSFSGTLPSNIEAPELSTLVMFSNQIGGSIPDSICKLKSLSIIDLSSNLLDGETPEWFEMQSIGHLLLSNNSLSGTFPAFLRNCTGLEFLDLAGNQLSGMLPSWIGELTNLRFLRLSHNRFFGIIPVEITELTYLKYLDLSGNYLSGVIPHLSNLTGMTWGENSFSNTITFTNELGGFVTACQFEDILLIITKGQQLKYGHGLEHFVSIDLSGNSLTGEIPLDVTSLGALINLNLSGNSLGGNIPNKIGTLQLLESHDLSKNKLFGEIPFSLSNLTSLSYLNLSYNNLSGRIRTGRQHDTLNADNPSLMYIGNSGPCGPPLKKNCSGNDSFIHGNHKSNRKEFDPMPFYLGLVVGLVVGRWMVFCALLFKKTWRIAYSRLFDKLYDRIHLFVVVKWAVLAKNTAAE